MEDSDDKLSQRDAYLEIPKSGKLKVKDNLNLKHKEHYYLEISMGNSEDVKQPVRSWINY